MGDRRTAHLSEEQLARLQDGELSAPEASHLEWCSECNGKLRDLESAQAAYTEYRDKVRGPALPPIPKPWRSLTALHSEYEARHPQRAWFWWQIPAVAAAVCLVVATVAILRRPGSVMQASELLTASANAEVPSDRMISIQMRGRALVRPAVLITASPESDADVAHLRTLFDEAHYSWRAPLSARSLQSWRAGVPDKRDSVTVIDGAGPEPAYRVRTDTGAGVLRSASLTLRGKNLRATNGTFQFQGEEPLEMGEAVAPAPKIPAPPLAAPRAAPVETPASPSDTLRVLAALNEIGADVGEPIDVSEDARQQIRVSSNGLSAERRQAVAAALQQLPHIKLDLKAAASGAPTPSARVRSSEKNSTGMPGPLRQKWEGQLGGAVALQEITDRVLEAGGSAVARAHAIEFLAGRFPPAVESNLNEQDRELLHKLQRGHVSELRRLASRIRSDLKPLLPWTSSVQAGNGLRPPWQTQAQGLLAAAHKLDESLNSLLAGTYSQSAGEAMPRVVAEQLDQLEQAIRRQQEGGK